MHGCAIHRAPVLASVCGVSTCPGPKRQASNLHTCPRFNHVCAVEQRLVWCKLVYLVSCMFAVTSKSYWRGTCECNFHRLHTKLYSVPSTFACTRTDKPTCKDLLLAIVLEDSAQSPLFCRHSRFVAVFMKVDMKMTSAQGRMCVHTVFCV